MAQAALKMMAGAGGNAETLYRTIVGDGTDGTSFTFSGITFGAPDEGRLIVAAVGAERLTTDGRCTGVTIGGITATRVVSYYGAATDGRFPFDIWAAVVPSGASGSIVATYNQTMINSFVSVWSNYNTQSSAYATMVADTSGTIDTIAGGALIAAIYGDLDPSHTLTGVNEDYDTTPTGSSFVEAGGHLTPTSTETGRTVSTSDTASFVLAASWRPA